MLTYAVSVVSLTASVNSVKSDGGPDFGGSILDNKASRTGIDISPAPPLTFTGGQKLSAIWRRFRPRCRVG